jgi:hypothetical protein
MNHIFTRFITALTIIFIICLELSTGCSNAFYTGDFDVPSCDDSTLKTRPHPAIGNYCVYYGGFHNHSGVSDGAGTPEYAYSYAKCVAGLDFFGLSDHDGYRTDANWRFVMDVANLYNVDSVFATFWGFEWTSSATYGHVTVVNTDDFTTSSSPGTQTFQQLCSWLSVRNCFAIFNHPGDYAFNTEFDHFLSPVCEKFVGMELWNKTTPFLKYYYNDGYITHDNNKSFFDEALTHGWKIGAAGGFDDHNATWGTAVDFRVAALAINLTRQDIFNAMKARRFYSTLDKNIALSFTMEGQEMGSTVPGGRKNLEIQASDGNGEIFSEVVLFDRNHDIRRSWNPDEAAVDITDTLTVGSGDYYYIKIKQQDGDEAISSPIWVSDSTITDALVPNNISTVN